MKTVVDAITSSDMLMSEGSVLWPVPERAVFFFNAGLRVDIHSELDGGYTVVYGGIISEHATSAEIVVQYLENLDD